MPIASQVTGARRSNSRQDEEPAMTSAENPILRRRDSEDGPGPVPEVRNRQNVEQDSGWFFSYSNWYDSLDKKSALVVLTLVYINLINYMDRSTVAGMIDSIKNDESFQINNDKYLGLLQTAFVATYMIFAPLFGYLGDRYDRTWIIGFGVSFWSAATLIGSFMTNFWWFMFFRALVGIGEASYSTIAPAIIADLFSKDTRSKILALFYFAIPFGTGLGYMIGAEIAEQTDEWRWGLRVTPFMGLLAVLGIIFFMEDPPRGSADGSDLRPSSPKEDLNALRRNKSFVLSTIAFTCVTFSAGALMWWGPQFAFYGAKAACGNKAGCNEILQSNISYRFGIVMGMAGILGVPAGSYVSQAIRHRVPNADPLVSGFSLLISVPVLFLGFLTARYSVAWCYGLTFVAGLLLNCNWAVVSDMTLYIVIPTRRSLASATQILCSHALGDAISPYLVGVIADWVRPLIATEDHIDEHGLRLAAGTGPDAVEINELTRGGGFTPKYYDVEFRCLQYALFLSCFFQAFGSFFFFMTSFYVLDDKREADRAISSGEIIAHTAEDFNADLDDDRVPIVRRAATNHDREEEE